VDGLKFDERLESSAKMNAESVPWDGDAAWEKRSIHILHDFGTTV